MSELEPKLNVANLASELGQVMSLLSKLNDPAQLALLEADGKLDLADVKQLMADVNKASADLSKSMSDLQAVLGV